MLVFERYLQLFANGKSNYKVCKICVLGFEILKSDMKSLTPKFIFSDYTIQVDS